MKKSKFIAISDIHGDISLAEKVSQKAKEENVDFILLPGDLGWIDELSEDVITTLAESQKKIFLVPGNHDTNTKLEAIAELFPQVYNLHGRGKLENNIGILGAGYATDTGPFHTDEEKIKSELEKSHKEIENAEAKIMMPHMHHENSKSEFSGFKGSSSLKETIEKFQPDIVLHGHIHEGGGIEEQIGKTKIFNVARKYKIFEL